jgi:hypothetical protein
MKPRYDVGIIACTRGKNPTGLTPLTLYKGTPFVVAMRHAQQRCGTILILSAKYGLLRTDDPVSYYDAYIPDLDAQGRQALVDRIRAEPWVELYAGKRILSYLPEAYFKLLAEAKPALAATISRPYRGLNMLALARTLSNEQKGYGIYPQRR